MSETHDTITSELLDALPPYQKAIVLSAIHKKSSVNKSDDKCRELEIERDSLAETFDMLDEVIKKMRPRYMGHPTMDGRFPCWNVWMPHTGTTERKSLKDAVLEYIEFLKTINK